jgi:hypothetical protein
MKYFTAMKKVTKREWILLGGALTLAFMVWLSDTMQRQAFDTGVDMEKLQRQWAREDKQYKDMMDRYNTPKK